MNPRVCGCGCELSEMDDAANGYICNISVMDVLRCENNYYRLQAQVFFILWNKINCTL